MLWNTNNSINDQKLNAEAAKLLQEAVEHPSAAASIAIDDFRKRSRAHRAAICRTQRLHDMAITLQGDQKDAGRSIWFHLDLAWARVSERALPLGASAGIAAIAFMLFSVFHTTEVQEQHVQIASIPVNNYTTGWQEQRDIQLEDGSRLWMDWNTQLSVTMSKSQRNITLHDGRAVFNVTTDAARPFFVTAGNTVTRVVGTEFVVSRQADHRVDVAVVEGRVQVSVGKSAVSLAPEQTVSVNKEILSDISSRPAEEMGRWREGYLIFRERPLLEALSLLQPYTGYELDTSDLSNAQGLVSGVFFINDATETLFALLEAHRLSYVVGKGKTLHIKSQ